MAETRWSPGEWAVADFNDGEAVILRGQKYRAVITYSAGETRDGKPMPRAERRANARLIAAAPELYEAVTVAHDFMLSLGYEGSGPFIAMERALAKACGEMP